MRKIKGISATTRIDTQGDQLTVGALMQHAEDANAAYYPFGLNHDPRIAPIGRIAKSAVVLRDDGEAALEFEAEIFEEGDVIRLTASERRLPPAILRSERALVYDMTFSESEVEVISNLARDLDLRLRQQTKKASIPLSVLMFCAASVGVPFLGELGKDLYKFGKNHIKQLCALMNKRGGNTRVLVLRFEIRSNSRPVQVEIFLTNPKEAEIEGILTAMKVSEIEQSLEPLVSNQDVVRVVAEYSNDHLTAKFMLRGDGVPFDTSGRIVAYKGDLPNGISISFQERE
jgi:hypothetical protein